MQNKTVNIKLVAVVIVTVIAMRFLSASVLKDIPESMKLLSFATSAYADETPTSPQVTEANNGQGKNKTSAEIVQPAAKGPQTTEEKITRPADKTSVNARQLPKAKKKYRFYFFYQTEDDQTQKMRKVYDDAMKKKAQRAESVVVNITDPSKKTVVDKFDVSRAPMPLVLVLASNGAIIGGFPNKFEEKQLLEAFVSPGMEKCLKALQERKLVFLCIQNEKTKQNDVAMLGVRNFKADARYGQATEIITLNPNNAAEVKFLKSLQINPNTDEALTAFIAPPGTIIAKFKGATDKDKLIAALTAAASSCGPSGCGPSGCGPSK